MKVSIEELPFILHMQPSKTMDSLTTMLPLKVELTRRENIEYYAKLPQNLDLSEELETSNVHLGGIYYYQEWNVLSFQLANTNIAPYKMIYLGEFETDLTEKFGNTKQIKANIF
ncbi:cyclophilin-like fold protein [Paucilactobacillus suebicus]|uniref:Cyclophilin-like domain-containing protein n=1 Tax=Paucilactobacillus suebicus DSM 5007 = KCTC 3549 TaxID=1423807 RepID=A0A0R1WC66_9LACO|nr:cyclophilin-like fold protein [Paucilactobacillus suebicus]KRM13195.1 hypothetical protein FD16_GL001340 [Paucilactobacillus suebicus DSM 5007 = KCTC 3549]